MTYLCQTNPLVSILFTLATNLSYRDFLTTLHFTTWLSLKSTGTGTNLSISELSTAVFKLAIYDFGAKRELSKYEIFLISAFVA